MNATIAIGRKTFDLARPHVMGILNLTPDSFSDGGAYANVDAAVARAKEMAAQGAAIIDLGGESTRPGHSQISPEEEWNRIAPVLRQIKEETDLLVSVDTYKPQVAEKAIEAGCDMINDIWGLKYDHAMAKLIADAKLACCLMHNRTDAVYNNFLEDVAKDMEETLEIAARYGIEQERILLDPGIGFGKTYEQNLLLLNDNTPLKQFSLPLLLGTSRKSVIGLALDLPKEEREEGTLTTSVYGYLQGYRFFRVHNVLGNVRALAMIEKIKKAGTEHGPNCD